MDFLFEKQAFGPIFIQGRRYIHISYSLLPLKDFPGGSDVKGSACDAGVQSPGWEDPLEKGMACCFLYIIILYVHSIQTAKN